MHFQLSPSVSRCPPQLCLIKIEAVFELHVHRNWFSVLHCGHEPNFASSSDRLSCEAIGQNVKGHNPSYLAACREDRSENNCSRNLIFACLLRIFGFGFAQYSYPGSHFFAREYLALTALGIG